MEELELQNGVIDVPDERDWKYSEVFGAVGADYPEEFSIDDPNDYENQALSTETKYACVFFSTNHGVNILNELEGVGEADFSGLEFARIATQKGYLNPTKGATVQSGPQLAQELGRIKGWALIQNDEFKHSLYVLKQPIVVCSDMLKYNKDTGEIIVGQGYGHAVLIIGWNKYGWIIKNSYGKTVGNNGRFTLKYEDAKNLFPSKYSLIDQENPIITYKKNIMDAITIDAAKKAFNNGLWNGINPTQPATREEVAAMVERAFEKLSVK